ncbi:hypothetical protein KR222_007667, partial [Zaprionus bogoriensis]
MSNFIVKVLQRRQLSHSQSDQKHFIYLHSRWLEDATELELLLTTSNASYRATLKHDEIRKTAEELEQPYEYIYAECKSALTTQMGQPGFDYELDEQQLQFKLLKCTGFETIYLEVPLRKLANCYQLLDAAIENAQRQQSISAAAAAAADSTDGPSTSRSANQLNEVLAQYEKYIIDSKQEKRTLLKKFAVLINSKKQHIEELEKQLEQRGTESATDSDTEMEELQVQELDDDAGGKAKAADGGADDDD